MRNWFFWKSPYAQEFGFPQQEQPLSFGKEMLERAKYV